MLSPAAAQQHLPAAHHAGHVRVAALVHRAGDARVVHFVETLHGLVAVVLSAFAGRARPRCAVAVDVVAALVVGEDLDAGRKRAGLPALHGGRVGHAAERR